MNLRDILNEIRKENGKINLDLFIDNKDEFGFNTKIINIVSVILNIRVVEEFVYNSNFKSGGVDRVFNIENDILPGVNDIRNKDKKDIITSWADFDNYVESAIKEDGVNCE